MVYGRAKTKTKLTTEVNENNGKISFSKLREFSWSQSQAVT